MKIQMKFAQYDATPSGWGKVMFVIKENVLTICLGLGTVLAIGVACFVWFIKKY